MLLSLIAVSHSDGAHGELYVRTCVWGEVGVGVSVGVGVGVGE